MSEYPLAAACSRPSASTAACSRNRSRLGRLLLTGCGVTADAAVGTGSTWLDCALDDKSMAGAFGELQLRRTRDVVGRERDGAEQRDILAA